MRTYNQLGMWNFSRIRADLGPAVEPHLKTMRRGAFVFLAFFAALLAIGATSAIVNAVTTGRT